MDKRLVFLSIMVFCILLINIASAEMLTSDRGVKYEKEIIAYFNDQSLVEELISQPQNHKASLEISNNQTWVSVIIYLKDDSQINNLVSDFSEEELKNVINRDIPNKSSLEKIGAQVSKKGFERLLNDSRVEKIYYSHPMYLLNKGRFNNNLFIILGVFILLILIVYVIIQKLKIKKDR